MRNPDMPGAKHSFPIPVALALIILFSLTACGGAPSGNPPDRVELELPTAQPTMAPSPVSTRVLPVEVLTPAPTPTITPIPDETLGLVVEVLDGDTIAVVLDGDPMSRAYEVRYLGIDAPPNSPDDPWGVVAYETNSRLTNLKVVRLVRDETDFDDDGYLLRYVYVGNQLVNAELVAQGVARVNLVEPDTRLQTAIRAAETGAKSKKLGLWSGRPPTPTPAATLPPVAAEEPAATRQLITPTVTVSATLTLSATGTITATPTAESTPDSTPGPTPTRTPTATASAEATLESDSGLQGPQ